MRGMWGIPVLQAIEWPVKGLVIPFIGDQLIGVVDNGEGIDQMSA